MLRISSVLKAECDHSVMDLSSYSLAWLILCSERRNQKTPKDAQAFAYIFKMIWQYFFSTMNLNSCNYFSPKSILLMMRPLFEFKNEREI